MSSSEVDEIMKLDDIATIKRKRAANQGNITKHKRRLDDYRKTNLDKINAEDVKRQLKEIERTEDLYQILSQRYIEVFSDETTTSETIQMEEKITEENLRQVELIRKAYIDLLDRKMLYKLCLEIHTKATNLIAVPAPRTSYWKQKFSQLEQSFDTLNEGLRGQSEDGELADQTRKAQDLINELSRILVEAETEFIPSAASSEPIVTAPTATAISTGGAYTASKLSCKLPKFNGEPLNFLAFKKLFSESIEKRAWGLTEAEKCNYLLEAMELTSCKDLVSGFLIKDDGYQNAMAELTKQYGSPHVLYPHYVEQLCKSTTTTKHRTSLRKTRRHIEQHVDNIEMLKGKSFDTFVAALAVNDFDDDLTTTWNDYKARQSIVELPTVVHVLKFLDEQEQLRPLRELDQPEPSSTHSNCNASTTHQQDRKLQSTTSKTRHNARSKPSARTMKVEVKSTVCPECGENHFINKCSTFLRRGSIDRWKRAKDLKLCQNCLMSNHATDECRSRFTCKVCKKRHHSVLHGGQDTPTEERQERSMPQATTALAQGRKCQKEKTAESRAGTLPTAVVQLRNGRQQKHVRVGFDSGAVTSLISLKLAKQMNYVKLGSSFEISGMHSSIPNFGSVNARLYSLHSEDFRDLGLHIVKDIPYARSPVSKQRVLDSALIKPLAPIADPELGGRVDILIGAADMIACSTGSSHVDPENLIEARPTIFGWVITTEIEPSQKALTRRATTQQEPEDLGEILRSLFEMDRITNEPPMTDDDQLAVDHFIGTHERQEDGRYKIKLPHKPNAPPLGASFETAKRRHFQNERSLSKKGQLERFRFVINEYFDLDHAEKVPESEIKTAKPTFYMPVHGVSKETSTTTKLRAVFDASAKTSNGVSFNETLLTGPNQYPLLQNILFRFRLKSIGISADIGKMFRQIVLHEDERDLHRFLRGTLAGVEICRMKRLTFGVKSSPYIATQVIQHWAKQSLETYPLAAKAILENFYVDDFLFSVDTTEHAHVLRVQLCNLLKEIGMDIRKWRTNDTELRKLIPEESLELSDLNLPKPLESSRALGIHWDVNQDTLHIAVPQRTTGNVTKREVASIADKVYDKLGLFSPALIPAKIILRETWKRNLDWDQEIPDDLQQNWDAWMEHIHCVAEHPVQRSLSNDKPVVLRELHGFADASEQAYGAVTYLRTTYEDGSVMIDLLYSQGRVVPVRANTIPRMELEALTLLAKQLAYVRDIMNIDKQHVYAWSDSEITLAWMKKRPSELKTYVGNRVQIIQTKIDVQNCNHVSSKDNPADLISRGISANKLIISELWWHGPSWLTKQAEAWKIEPLSKMTPPLPEVRVHLVVEVTDLSLQESLSKFSSYHMAQRVVAWVRRFIANTRRKIEERVLTFTLNSEELQGADITLLKLAQRQGCLTEIRVVHKKEVWPKGHVLKGYEVELDEQGLLVASGRVRKVEEPKQLQTRIFLTLKSPIAKLFIKHLHSFHNHAGISVLMATINQSYIIPGLRNELKRLSRQCVRCRTAYCRPLTQQMGPLPSCRTTPASPFTRTGIDFAGPVYIKQGATRKPVKIKTYICLFTCMTTKAVHIELCHELTTEAFIQAFKRFKSRRGIPKQVYSDNGSNFIGAKSEIEELQRMFEKQKTKQAISHLVTDYKIQWHNTPPRAPHFGGLWETSIRLMKLQIRKIVSAHLLTFEELSTVLAECEAILNSRPITSLESTSDELVLTAGHFLIGKPLTALPNLVERNKEDINLLKRWKLVKELHSQIWITWVKCYVSSLQARAKWHLKKRNLKVNDIVLVKDDVLKHLTWPLARVVKVYTGDDKLVRVVDIRIGDKIYKRSIHRLVLLVPDNEEVKDHRKGASEAGTMQNNEIKEPTGSDEESLSPAPGI